MTKRYRALEEKQPQAGFVSPFEAIAYVAARLPATFAAVKTVLSHVSLKDVTSVLDLGAGPGTAALAAALHWTHCKNFHLIEGNAFMKGLSETLLKDIPEISGQSFSFQQANLLTVPLGASFDIVILSYVLGELSLENQAHILKKAWEKAKRGIVLVMPGTPSGYRQLMAARNQLIERGAFIAAPCPHQEACPLKTEDWCHFSVRLPRPSFHREIKGVFLPYEDEKFSYLVALREPVSHSSPGAFPRVIRRPLHRSGHVTLDLCTSDGLKRETISKKNKALYKEATKIKWGDDFGSV
jgi:ribosomal protein RSM22 (predicted rRNA methylase)